MDKETIKLQNRMRDILARYGMAPNTMITRFRFRELGELTGSQISLPEWQYITIRSRWK